MNDPMTILKRDHRDLKRMLKELSDTEATRERQRLLKEIEANLTLHMEIEEQSLYPVLQRKLGKEKRQEADVEHDLAREGLAKAKDMVSVPGFGAVVEMLTAGIQHHVDEEEKELLPKLKAKLPTSQWEALGDQIMAAKEAAMPKGVRIPQTTGRAASRR